MSIRCGERVLLPSVREASRESLVITDGFSCREQILQETDHHALHLAQVMQMALHEGPAGPVGELPESEYAQVVTTSAAPVSRVVGAGALAAAGIWMEMRHQKGRQPETRRRANQAVSRLFGNE